MKSGYKSRSFALLIGGLIAVISMAAGCPDTPSEPENEGPPNLIGDWSGSWRVEGVGSCTVILKIYEQDEEDLEGDITIRGGFCGAGDTTLRAAEGRIRNSGTSTRWLWSDLCLYLRADLAISNRNRQMDGDMEFEIDGHHLCHPGDDNREDQELEGELSLVRS